VQCSSEYHLRRRPRAAKPFRQRRRRLARRQHPLEPVLLGDDEGMRVWGVGHSARLTQVLVTSPAP
ncbi:MAG: hypothetical protein ABIK43_06690, partial [candidate division WOR-3 bacterium]